MPFLPYIITSLITASVVFIGGINLPSDTLAQLSLKTRQMFGNVGYTSISTATNLASFPATYNANATAFDNGKIDSASTSINAITTLSNLVTVGTLTSGALSTGFTAVPVSLNGTGTTSPTAKQIMFGNGASGLQVIGFGTTNQFLQSQGANALPAWATSNLDLTATNNWSTTGTTTFSGGVETGKILMAPAISATSTTATSTFSGGLYSPCPSSDGIHCDHSYVLFHSGNIGASTTNTSTTTVKTVAIPANTISVNKSLRINSTWTAAGNDCFLQIDYGTGTATSTIGYGLEPNPSFITHAEATVNATSTTGVYGSFLSTVGATLSNNLLLARTYVASFFRNTDTTAVSYIDFRAIALSGGTCTLLGATVEVISN